MHSVDLLDIPSELNLVLFKYLQQVDVALYITNVGDNTPASYSEVQSSNIGPDARSSA